MQSASNMLNTIRRYKVLPEIYIFPAIYILLFSMPPKHFTPFNYPEHLPECRYLLTLSVNNCMQQKCSGPLYQGFTLQGFERHHHDKGWL